MATATAPAARPAGAPSWFDQAEQAARRTELPEAPTPEIPVSAEQAEEQIRQFQQEGGE